MFKKPDALHAPDEGDAATGAGGGGSPEGEQGNKPKDGEFVPKTQFIAAINSATAKHEREMAALRAEMDAKLAEAIKAAKPAPEAPKRYTRAQLNAAVSAGEVTQEQADAEIERQIREDAKAEARREATSVVRTEQRQERIDRDIARYKAVAPEILDEGHDTRQRIKQEFSELVGLGDDPKDLATQLKAIRAVLGPIGSLERSRSGERSHDPHRESGGSTGVDGGRPAKKFSDTLDQRTREHYQKLIHQGLYKDWAAVEEERKFARPHRRIQA